MFRQFGWVELLIVLGIALLIFGPSQLPQLGKAVGRTIREFRQNLSGDVSESSVEQGQPDEGS